MTMKYILIFAAVPILILGSIATFNYKVDPMCYYQCTEIDTQKLTINYYYQVAQKMLSHKDTEAIVLGSSRGESTSPLWIQSQTGLKAMNLSVGGAEVLTKTAFLNLALKTFNLKKVFWLADFFELVPETTDVKIKNTPSLRDLLISDLGPIDLATKLNNLAQLIDHNTFEASLARIKKFSSYKLDLGSGSDIVFKECLDPLFKGEKTHRAFEQEKAITYDTYSRKVLKFAQNEEYYKIFIKKLEDLSKRGIDTKVVILPYNPDFLSRLTQEYPDIVERHHIWIARLKSISLPNIKIVDQFGGIPGDDRSERFWNDGVHFTCKGAITLLQQSAE